MSLLRVWFFELTVNIPYPCPCLFFLQTSEELCILDTAHHREEIMIISKEVTMWYGYFTRHLQQCIIFNFQISYYMIRHNKTKFFLNGNSSCKIPYKLPWKAELYLSHRLGSEREHLLKHINQITFWSGLDYCLIQHTLNIYWTNVPMWKNTNLHITM